jgi:hypothetical protein
MTAVTGTDVLRGALYARLHKGALPLLARDLNVGIARLEDFARGQGKLPPEILASLAKEFFNADYNSAADRLQSVTKQPPQLMGIAPEPFDPKAHPPAGRNFGGHSPYSPVKSVPTQKQKRPGWL